MDELLGNKAAEAKIMESSMMPKGDYAMELTGVEQGAYELKNEDHPYAGEEAAMLTLIYKVNAVDDKGKYFDAKDKRVDANRMEEFVGKDYKENCMFGNDGLVIEGSGDNRVMRLPETEEDKAKVKNSGFDKVVTLLSRHIGEERWAEGDCDNKSLQELIDYATGMSTVTPIGHNKWGDRVNVQINIMDDFTPIV